MAATLSRLGGTISRIKDRFFTPTSVGALEISATSVKYLLAQGNSITQASLRLPPGIIERGRIKDAKLFEQALRNVHLQIAPSTKQVSVMLSLPQSIVYTQAFTVPMVAQGQLEESITLNLQMISPSAVDETFYDYQEIQERQDMGQFELLGAFAQKADVKNYTDALKTAGFIPVTVGFPALSLARLIKLRWGGLANTEDYLVLYISSEGVMALILKNGNLAFNRFTPWYEITKGTDTDHLTFPQIKDFIVDDLQKIMTFYLGRTGKQLSNAVLISPIFNFELITLVRERLGITMHNLAITELPNLQPSWFTVLGGALRGAIPRNKDLEITLSEKSSQREYLEERSIDFIILWRNIIVGALLFVLGAFIVTTSIFSKQQEYLTRRIQTEFDARSLADNVVVQGKIQSFNGLVALLTKTAERERIWSPFLTELQSIAGKDVALKKISIDSGLNFILNGSAKNDEVAIALKERLASLPYVKNVSLPLNQITREGDTGIFFDNLRGTFTQLPEKGTR